MNEKQKKFAEEYLIDCNATQAAKRAGYSERTAYCQGQRLLKDAEVKAWIDGQLERMHSERIASIREVLEYLTKGLRQELTEEVVVVEGTGDGCSEATTVRKKISLKDSNKCAELLAKRYGLLTDKVAIDGAVSVVVCDDVKEDS